MRPVGTDDDHPNVVIMHGQVQGAIHFVEHLLVLGVADVRPGQHDAGHAIGGLLVANLLKDACLGHGGPLLRSTC